MYVNSANIHVKNNIMAPNPSPNPSPARPFGCLLILLVLALICGGVFWQPPVTLDDIEIPGAANFTCQPIAINTNAGPALELGENGLWFTNAIVLSGLPSEISRVAGEALGVAEPIDTTPLVGQRPNQQTIPSAAAGPVLQRYSGQALSLYSTGQDGGQGQLGQHADGKLNRPAPEPGRPPAADLGEA